MDTFGWCFIGCGGLAGRVAEQIAATGRHRIVSAWCRSPERRAAFAPKHGALAADSPEQAITVPGVDGVYVVTPHQSHYTYARLSLELGRPVLCEKPFTVSAPEAAELMALAREKGLYIAEAMWTWFAPAANRVKAWLDSGAFGEIRRAEAAYRVLASRSAARLFDPDTAGGALLDIGIYPVTYLYRLFGKPSAVRCTGVVAEGIDWEEDVDLTFPSGQTFRASASIRDSAGSAYFSMEGAKASIYIPAFYGTDRAELVRTDGSRETAQGDGSYVREFDAVAGEIREGLTESRYVPHRATLDVLEILDECRRQLGLRYPFEGEA